MKSVSGYWIHLLGLGVDLVTLAVPPPPPPDVVAETGGATAASSSSSTGSTPTAPTPEGNFSTRKFSRKFLHFVANNLSAGRILLPIYTHLTEELPCFPGNRRLPDGRFGRSG